MLSLPKSFKKESFNILQYYALSRKPFAYSGFIARFFSVDILQHFSRNALSKEFARYLRFCIFLNLGFLNWPKKLITDDLKNSETIEKMDYIADVLFLLFHMFYI